MRVFSRHGAASASWLPSAVRQYLSQFDANNIDPDYNMMPPIFFVTTKFLLIKSNLKFESRPIAVRIVMLLHTKDVPRTSAGHGTGEIPVTCMGPTFTTYVWANYFDSGFGKSITSLSRGDVPGTGPAPTTTTTTCLWPVKPETSPSAPISVIKLRSKCCKRPSKCRPLQQETYTLSRYPERRPTPFASGSGCFWIRSPAWLKSGLCSSGSFPLLIWRTARERISDVQPLM